MNRQGFLILPGLLALAFSGAASAIGLGELRGEPVLGERVVLKADVLGAENAGALDASCFRLIRPLGGDQLPWLRQASLRLERGKPPQLVITASERLRDPVFKVALHIACGHEVHREYTLLASLSSAVPEAQGVPLSREASSRPVQAAPSRPMASPRPAAPARTQPTERMGASVIAGPRSARGQGEGDRLLLSAGDVDAETALRLDAVLGERMLQGELADSQREILRLEFRMLAALHEQADSQLAAAEKLRAMETALDALQTKMLALTEKADASAPAAPAVSEAPMPASATSEDAQSLFSTWTLYGLLAGLLIVLAGSLLWRQRQKRLARDDDFDSLQTPALAPVVDAPRAEELQGDRRESDSGVHARGPLDLHLETAPAGAAKVDVELEGGRSKPPRETPMPAARPGDSVLSINATTLDEHFEANPVMELADIMLSFGRVKGAAQALQEYIDNNPQEALQPWIRLMDVYRMAGMREEFDAVARNLNQHFNVEVQSWEAESAPVDLLLDDAGSAAMPGVARAQGVEDMPRILNTVIRMWESDDVVGYLYELLRDNRGGQRQGFALPVVEEILFLIELKETSNRIEKEKAGQA